MDRPLYASHPGGDGLLGWLHLGKVPFMILVIVFLTAFGLTGFATQMAARAWLQHFLPLPLVSVSAFVVALPAVRLVGGALGKVLPQDETFAVSLEDLVGRIATVVTGTASLGIPAQARVRDVHGRSHYVLVEPDSDTEFTPGTEVLLVRRLSGTRFQSIPNPKPGLLQS
ncbi:MAG: YqiJ family protein [Gammaproteobacteria bacterium]